MVKMKLFFIVLLLSSTVNYHAIYVSVMEIYPGDGFTEIKIKVFSDDLQNALRNYSDKYHPGPISNFIEPNQTLITSYFNNKISLAINDTPIALEFLSAELENDAHFLTFRGPETRGWSEVKIRADYFMELFPDQSNIISVSYGKEKLMGRLTASEKETILKISR